MLNDILQYLRQWVQTQSSCAVLGCMVCQIFYFTVKLK
jgi:hypothetical protein